MDSRYDVLDAAARRRSTRDDAFGHDLLVIDEIAYYSATAGDSDQREQFSRCCATSSPAAAPPESSSSPPPSGPRDIIPTSLRDLFGYRLRVPLHHRDVSSDIVLGHGWAARGYNAADIDPGERGVG